MKPIAKFILLVSLYIGAASLARGQAVLDKTSLGKSQNDSREVANSLVPGPQRYGKGDKKEQVNAADLKSKSIKDATFGGSLLDMGIVGAEPKLDEQKLRIAPTENDSKASKESHANSGKDPKQTENAGSNKESRVFTPALGEAQNKQQRSTSTATDEKPSTNSTEKASATKRDGGGND